MKKIIPVLFALVIVTSACGIGGNAEPTPIPIATAFPTAEVEMNATAKPANQNTDAGSERISPVDGMVQVFVPAGSFRMGAMDANSSPDELPDHAISLDAFWIDKLEVTNAMYFACVQAGACEPPDEFNSESREKYFNTDEFADYPVVYVTWEDANAYCAWAGKRLPTEAEWERAARGDDFRIFPWGDDRATTSFANFNRKVGDTTRVGSFPAGAGPFGTLDQAGNVWEWVSDFYDPNYYGLSVGANPTGPLSALNVHTQQRVTRGGSFQDVENDIRLANRGYASGSNLDANLDSAEYHGESSSKIGFRCAASN
jgi:formylglycine-generating enzyme required for sulfatase activity